MLKINDILRIYQKWKNISVTTIILNCSDRLCHGMTVFTTAALVSISDVIQKYF